MRLTRGGGSTEGERERSTAPTGLHGLENELTAEQEYVGETPGMGLALPSWKRGRVGGACTRGAPALLLNTWVTGSGHARTGGAPGGGALARCSAHELT